MQNEMAKLKEDLDRNQRNVSSLNKTVTMLEKNIYALTQNKQGDVN